MQNKTQPLLNLRVRKPRLLSQAKARAQHTREKSLLLRRWGKRQAKHTIHETAIFVLTTAVIFIFIFGALNFSAYQKQVLFWWEHRTISGETLRSSMTKVPTETRQSTLQPVKPAQSLPLLSLQITPPVKKIVRLKPTQLLFADSEIKTVAENSAPEETQPVSPLASSVISEKLEPFKKLTQFFTPKPKLKPLIASYQPAKTIIKKIAPSLNTEIMPPDNYLAIPRLGIRAPIREVENIDLSIGDWDTIEDQIQEVLREGIVHFPGTAEPGEQGNAFLTGHSSYYPWDSGRYKDIFALLPKIETGDLIEIYQDQEKFVYRVSEITEVAPDQTDVLQPTDDYRLTLMTCTPVGTTLKRLIVTAILEQ